MKLEKQVISLDIAKRLKELEVKQESVWYWALIQGKYRLGIIDIDNQEIHVLIGNRYAWYTKDSFGKLEIFSAFTVAELGELALEGYYTEKNRGNWLGLHAIRPCKLFVADTEANARGDMFARSLEVIIMKARDFRNSS